MQCPRCLNQDPAFFYCGSKGWYCRKCISFSRVLLQEEQTPVSLEPVSSGVEEYVLSYPLTSAQKQISQACMETISKKDVLLKCVCGAGKTEMVIETIAWMLKQKKKVCFAIARRQVVLELQARLQPIFPHASVIAVCGGHTQVTDGDLIICTTHQLYRYYQAFDCLILDEPDAFPFKGNVVLHGIAKTACKGHCIYLTATPDTELTKGVAQGKIQMLELNRRPHGKKLPEPKVIVTFRSIAFARLVHWLKKHHDHSCMVFVPTIAQAKRLSFFLRFFIKCDVCTSKTENRDACIEQFRKNPNGCMVCTTVLERGVTIPGVDVCVWEADSFVFDEASLIQMSGRVGRTFSRPTGDCLFLCLQKSEKVQACVEEIQRCNAWKFA